MIATACFLLGLTHQYYQQQSLVKQLQNFDTQWRESQHNSLLQIHTEPYHKSHRTFFRARLHSTVDSQAWPALYVSVTTKRNHELHLGDWIYTRLPTYRVPAPWLSYQLNPMRWKQHRNLGYIRLHSNTLHAVRHARFDHEPLMYLRSTALQKFLSTTEQHSHRAETLALVFGEQSHLSTSVKHLFQQTGTAHLVAISGLHFSMLAQYLDRLFLSVYSQISSHNPKRCAYISSCTVLFCYAIIAGFSPSCLRAFLMSCINITFRSFYLRYNPIQIITLAAFVHYLLLPHHFCLIGFQLSYGIVLSAMLWQRYLQKILPSFFRMLSMPIISTSWSYLYWRQLCLVAPLANLIAVSWITYSILPASLLYVILSPISIHCASALSNWLSINWILLYQCLNLIKFYVPY